MPGSVHDAAHHRIAAALVAAVVTGSVAVRRRYPALVGTAVPIFAAFNFTRLARAPVRGLPDRKRLRALRARGVDAAAALRVGLALVVAAFLATSAAPGGSLRGAVPFAVVTAVVMLLVRRVVGDRERRAQHRRART